MTVRRVAPSATATEMTQIVMPGHCNALGTVFGGQVMAWIDVAAAVAAQRFVGGPVVTASMDGLVFRNPARIGDVMVLRATVNWAGRTSMEVGVRAESEDLRTRARTHTSSAWLTFVALGDDGRPVQTPTLTPETDTEHRRWREAEVRRASRLRLRDQLSPR